MPITRLDTHQDQAGAWDVLLEATGRLVFDVGANIGQSTRVLARNFDQVVALEPCEESFAVLAREMPENVFPLCVAAAAVHGHLTLVEAATSIATGQLVSAGRPLPMWGTEIGTRTVPATTVDSLSRLFGIPDFCKIDTEGGEVEVLEGARDTLAEGRTHLLVEMHREEHASPVEKLLTGYHLSELRHGGYVRRGGPVWTNHWWIVATPSTSTSTAPSE